MSRPRTTGMLKIGGYELISHLDLWSHGSSFKARRLEDDRLINFRIIRFPDDNSSRARLCTRLRQVALLRSPAIQGIHDLVLDHDPPYFCVDRTECTTLQSRLDSGLRLTFDQVVLLGQQLASALIESHRLGVVHGRLSSKSVFVDDDGGILLNFVDSIDAGPQPKLPSEDIQLLADLLTTIGTSQPGDRTARVVDGTNKSQQQLEVLIRQMKEPSNAPEALEVLEKLHQIGSVDPTSLREATGEYKPASSKRERIGRFRILAKVGEGGMAEVYKAVDESDDSIVAIKTLKPQLAVQREGVRRFFREGRLLAQVQNPHVIRVLEVNQHEGVPYLAMEFVSGDDLAIWMHLYNKAPQQTSVEIVASVARGLGAVHRLGIVHRDIKPGNILIGSGNTPEQFDTGFVKLTDFGLARHFVDRDTKVTQTGAILGTPSYMSPEQCTGGPLSAATDVYAIGVTLYHLLSGSPPFQAEDPFVLMAKHCNDVPPDLSQDIDPALWVIVRRMLEKAPEARYQDADELLSDLDGFLRGDTTPAELHPKLPDTRSDKAVKYSFQWDLEGTPDQLWPFVTDTDRLNQAIGLPAVGFSAPEASANPADRVGQTQIMGSSVEWTEHPFEWIEPTRFGVLREFVRGPFRWFLSAVELTPATQGGTLLRHTIWIEPRGLLGRIAASVEMRTRAKRSLDRVYRRIDAAVTKRLPLRADAFVEPHEPAPQCRERISSAIDRLTRNSVDVAVLEQLEEYVSHAPAQQIVRIRPLVLARVFQKDPETVFNALLHAAREGLLCLKWDLICPVCRVAADLRETLEALKNHGHCKTCDLDFKLDQANAIELVFQVHPDIRTMDSQTYCIGGPGSSPHTLAQVRVSTGETLALNLRLVPGSYRLRAPHASGAVDFEVCSWGGVKGWHFDLSDVDRVTDLPTMDSSGQRFTFFNSAGSEQLVRIERTTRRLDTMTAADASSYPAFRELFPYEILAPGHLVSVQTCVFLVVGLTDTDSLQALPERESFQTVHRFLDAVIQIVNKSSGAVVRTLEDRVLVCFRSTETAIETAFQLLEGAIARVPLPVIRVAIHCGPTYLATLDRKLDYFGASVRLANSLLDQAGPSELVFSEAVYARAKSAADGRNFERLIHLGIPGFPNVLYHQYRAKSDTSTANRT